MKIVKLTAENIKRLRAVEITPDGNTVVITGRNGQGKTSVLDSIWYALGGGPAAKGTTRPVRDGQDRAEVTVDLGDLVVTRSWTSAGGTALRVENTDGARYKSPQQMLDGLVGKLSFDPLTFAQQSERDQLATLVGLVDLPFDPAEIDTQRRGLYEERTIVGREVRQLEGQLDGMATPAPFLPEQEIPSAQLLAEFREAQNDLRARQDAHDRFDHCKGEVERLRAELAAAEKQLKSATRDLPAGPVPDLVAIEKRLESLEVTNAGVRAAQARAEVAARLQVAQDRYDGFTREIDALDEGKAEAIAAARMPIDGLGFDDDGVTYNGVPFKQCSSAEQLRVSLAMAMALNPKIRVIRITDGSLLDSENLALIEAMADAADFQVWIERVDESGAVGVVIEDGQVVTS